MQSLCQWSIRGQALPFAVVKARLRPRLIVAHVELPQAIDGPRAGADAGCVEGPGRWGIRQISLGWISGSFLLRESYLTCSRCGKTQ